MTPWLRDPVDQSVLTEQPGALVSASGRYYPARAGGWDLRPEASTDQSVVAHAAAHAAAQAEIYDAMTGEFTDFDHPHNLVLAHQRRLLERVPLNLGDAVLEIGGHRSGVLAWLERHRSVQGQGIDISPEWVAAQNEAAAARGGRSSWVLGTAEHLPFASGSFRAIVAFDVFEHLANLRGALEECVRVLGASGTLVCHMPVADIGGSFDGFQRWRDPADYAARQASVGHFHERMPSRLQMRTLLEQAGFHVLDMQNMNVWFGPLHDHRVLPWLGRLRHRKGKPTTTGVARAPMRTAASGFQRVYAAAVMPFVSAATSADQFGALLGIGGSCSFVATKARA